MSPLVTVSLFLISVSLVIFCLLVCFVIHLVIHFLMMFYLGDSLSYVALFRLGIFCSVGVLLGGEFFVRMVIKVFYRMILFLVLSVPKSLCYFLLSLGSSYPAWCKI